jgi:phosphohistidine phosphatase
MKRKLIVLRHAKSAWPNNTPTDHARPLSKRGRSDAPRVGARLSALHWQPQWVIASDALRARQTWESMQGALGQGATVRFVRELYDAGAGAVWQVLTELPDDVHTAMVIGHNPGWEEVVEEFTGYDVQLTTCNAALLSIDAESWASAASQAGGWSIEHIVRPKEL